MNFLLLLFGLVSVDLPQPSDAQIAAGAVNHAQFQMHQAHVGRSRDLADAAAAKAAEQARREVLSQTMPKLPPPPKELCDSWMFAC